MRSKLRVVAFAGVAAGTLAMMGCKTIGTAGRSAGNAAGNAAEAAGHAAGTAAEGAGDIIHDTAHEADKEMR
jgi:hypothetical protein